MILYQAEAYWARPTGGMDYLETKVFKTKAAVRRWAKEMFDDHSRSTMHCSNLSAADGYPMVFYDDDESRGFRIEVKWVEVG